MAFKFGRDGISRTLPTLPTGYSIALLQYLIRTEAERHFAGVKNLGHYVHLPLRIWDWSLLIIS